MLPHGWAAVDLIDIADFVMGQAPPGEDCNFEGRGMPFVKAGEFGPVRPVIREWTTRPLKIAKQEDVLICVVGATAGKINLGADCAIGRSVAAIRPNEASMAEFLYPRLKTEVDRLRRSSTGTAQGVISREMLADIKISLPPLAEQRRIVLKLEALSARLARARADLDGVELLTKKLRSSALSMQISTSGGEVVRLGDVLEDVRYGTSKKCEYNGGATPVLRIPNIQKGRIATEDLKAADFDASERQKLALVSGDVLIIRSNGTLDLVGKSAIIDERAAGMLYAGYLIRLRVNKKRLRPEYLQAFLSAPNTRDILENLARSTSGVNNINAEQLKDLMIPLPSLERQDEAITQVKLASAHSDRLEAEASKAKILIGRLESAILGKAFKGELVPQDPNDEPAGVLLARIRAQREAAVKVPGGRGGRRKAG